MPMYPEKHALASSLDENIMYRATVERSKPTLISFPKELGFTGEASKSNLRLKTLSAPITMDFDSLNSSQTSKRRSSFLPDSLRNDAEKRGYVSTRRSTFITPTEVTLGTAFVMGQRSREEQKKTMTKFGTGSKYIGEWNQLGMAGKGVYKFPHGVLYDGYFNKKGEFHGSGMLIYPNGQRIEGFWRNGKLSSSPSYVTKDNNVMCDTYCRMPDRRFQIELEKDFNCAGQEYLTNAPNPPRPIPSGCYDAGEGFYNPKEKAIFSYKERADATPKDIIKEFEKYLDKERLKSYHALLKDETAVAQLSKIKLKSGSFFNKRFIIDIVHDAKEKWIVENCRKAWDEATGYNSKLFEDWTTGTKYDTRIQRLDAKMQDNDTKQMVNGSFIQALDGDQLSKASLMYSFIRTFHVKEKATRDDNDMGEDSDESLQALSTMFVPTLQKRSILKYIQIDYKNLPPRPRKYQDKEKSKKLKFKLRKARLRKSVSEKDFEKFPIKIKKGKKKLILG